MRWMAIPSFEELEREIAGIKETYPGVQTAVFGQSEDGRNLYSLRLTAGEEPEPLPVEMPEQEAAAQEKMAGKKETLLILGGIHGRESVNPAVLLQMVKDLAYLQQQEDPVLLGLLEDYDLLFVPLANPDGYEIARIGFEALRNPELRKLNEETGIPWKEWKANARAVDLNRNFPSIHYRKEQEGDVPGSEKETKALMELMQANSPGALMDFHSRGEIIYYFRGAMPKAYNERQLALARFLQEESGYYLGTPEDDLGEDNRGGNTVHFYSEYIKGPAFTIETVPSEAAFPLAFYWLDIVYEQIKNLPVVMLEALKTIDT